MTKLEKNLHTYNLLSSDKNIIIQMYITARQFKNAIDITEMIIIPTNANELSENEKVVFKNMITMTARGDKIINKIFPFIVNKAFSCEVYLKIIIKIIGLKIPKGRNGHDLSILYSLANSNFNLSTMFLSINSKFTNDFIVNEILKISNVFIKWRYIYDYLDDNNNIVNITFLNTFCNYLDIYTIKLIKQKFDYNVEFDMR